MNNKEFTSVEEDYLEVIYFIGKNKKPVKTMQISRYFGNSPSTVTEMLQKLSEKGLLVYEKYRGVSLTKEGLRISRQVAERHRLLSKFLAILGVPEDIAEEDACRIEHVVNIETMNRLREFVEFVEISSSTRWKEEFYLFKKGM